MECTIAALIACFSWSGFFVDSGLLYQDSGIEQFVDTSAYRWIPGEQDFALHSSTHQETRYPENPYGRIGLGYQVELPHITLSVEFQHVSSLATGKDRGVNSVQLRARWYPFR